MRFPLFRDNWTKYRVSDLLETYPTNSLSWDQLSYDISKLKNIHYGLIHNGFETTCIDVKSDLIPYIKLAYYPKKYTLLKIGDLILADASEDREDVGKSIEIIEEVKQKTISGLHTIHARDKVNFIIKGFKGFYFKSKPMKEQIFKIANGSKIYGITSSNFNELYMCMPGKLEQEKIVSLMMKIEQRIQTQSKIIDLYTSLIKSIEDNIFWNNTDYHSLPIKKILTEIIEKSIIQNQYPILSSTKQGIFLQSEYFNKEAASSNNIGYKITHKGDIIISPQNLWMG
ncbi:restriction endonuclease subunit S, partial [[Clostridium] cocleatum]